MKIYKPPSNIRNIDFKNTVFLAGSIEMGKADNWQDEICDDLSEFEGIILNPRRDNWDSSWEQSINNLEFRKQVQWELFGLENASVIIMYLQPNTNSKVSMLELGLYIKSKKILVCCPDGYDRKGNVEITCKSYGIPIIHDFDTLKKMTKKLFE